MYRTLLEINRDVFTLVLPPLEREESTLKLEDSLTICLGNHGSLEDDDGVLHIHEELISYT